MKRTHMLLTLFTGLVLAACGPGGAGGPGPRTWIDAPLDGSTMELGPVIVRSHAASDGGSAQAALLVDGTQVRLDSAEDPASPLVEFTQTWMPAANGDYTLQVITTDHEGNQGRSNTVRVRIGQLPATQTYTTTSTETITPTPATPTPTEASLPSFLFDQNANCRLGDSTAYDAVIAFSAGDEAPIEGQNSASTWFWVLTPGGGHCWVAGSTGTPTGPFESVQVIAPPPLAITDTPVPDQAPTAPGNLQVAELTCNAQDGYRVRLTWQDNANNEDGYRVYHKGTLLTTLGPNATQYVHQVGGDISQQQSYVVEAYNDAGAAQSDSATEDGCLY